jgi:hypothetical protein
MASPSAATAAVASGKSGRSNLANIYRPVGPKSISLGLNAAPGQQITLSQVVDLSIPIRGVRLVLKGRCVVGTTGMASTTPEGFLNLLSTIVIQGTNARQKGNVTLWSVDLASLYGFQHLVCGDRAAYYSINANGGAGETQVSPPAEPWPTDNNPTGTTGTYDYRIVVDLPFHPFASQYFGAHPHWIPAYLVRNEEWKDSLQLQFTFASVANGAVAGPLGTGASGTTLTFTAYGSGSGNPTLDVYSLGIIMGLDLKDQVLPGILSRTNNPINTILQSAGTGVTLVNMQKQPTTRIYMKFGVGTVSPIMSSLSDTNVTALGILLGANRNVRNVVDVWAHKGIEYDTYERKLIQGYDLFDFMESGNPDSAYPGQNIGDGATFQLTANVAGVSNAQGIILQEQTLHTPTGALYTF